MSYGFYFEYEGRGAQQGAISASEQFFEGARAETSLARETAQNSIDASIDELSPVTMAFELADMHTDDVPGVDDLREHMASVEIATTGRQGHERMKEASATAVSGTISVLRIGDSGTTGLRGTESRDDPNSALSALTTSSGISVNDGKRGGSFGIGSAVGLAASSLCTVFYSSKSVDDASVVLAGHTRLASHRDRAGKWRVANGFYTDLDVSDDFRFLRNPGPFGPFSARTELGTDTFILGYRKAGDDPGLRHIHDALVNNFLMAIHRGRLIAEGKRQGETLWRLDQASIEQSVRALPEARAFYRAIISTPAVRQSKRFGELRLHINIDDSLQKTLNTTVIRKPLMKIDSFKHTSIAAKYAAVLECSDEIGNRLLRGLEPPQHDQLDHARAPGGAAALTELKTFIREELRARVKLEIGERVEIKGLARYLPSSSFAVPDPHGPAGRPGIADGTEDESSTVQGDPSNGTAVRAPARKTVAVKIATNATESGTQETSKGKDLGGKGDRKDGGTGLPGVGGPGSGSSRIRSGDIRFRSWSDETEGAIRVRVTAMEDVFGDLELVALGPSGVPEKYDLPITSATITVNGTSTEVTVQENILLGLNLPAGQTARISLYVPPGLRYRLGVK